MKETKGRQSMMLMVWTGRSSTGTVAPVVHRLEQPISLGAALRGIYIVWGNYLLIFSKEYFEV